ARIQHRARRPPCHGGGQLSRLARNSADPALDRLLRQGTSGRHLQRYLVLEPEPPRGHSADKLTGEPNTHSRFRIWRHSAGAAYLAPALLFCQKAALIAHRKGSMAFPSRDAKGEFGVTTFTDADAALAAGCRRPRDGGTFDLRHDGCRPGPGERPCRAAG